MPEQAPAVRVAGLRKIYAGGFAAVDVPGLYAAGDTATRELICGGFTGGGSHNAAWAASSGSSAGAATAAFSRQHGRVSR